jgi:hypothetical protein
VVDLDAALGQQFLRIPVRQAVLLAAPGAGRAEAAGLCGDVAHQPNGALTQLVRVFPRCWHGSALPWVRSFHQPGALQ